MSKLNISKFKDLISSTSWNDLYKEYDADRAYQQFMTIISSSSDWPAIQCVVIGRMPRYHIWKHKVSPR